MTTKTGAQIGAAPAGKARQRRRTRSAIVAATQRLLAAGTTPSVSEIADEADVSRRTVYQHFATLDQLLLDATIGALSSTTVDDALAAVPPDGSPQEYVAAMVRSLCDMNTETLSLGRSMLKLTVDQPPTGEGLPRRGYRRIAWIEQALQPLRPILDTATFERLVSGLAMVIGWEALIVLEDVRGLSRHQRTETCLWAAEALVAAALHEQAQSAAIS
jgi:AcrR family transcriptional regulator